MDTYGFIYLVRNRINGKVYIGQSTTTVGRRWKEHQADAKKGAHKHLHRAIRKYGAGSFDVVTLHQALSKEELDEMEIRSIWSHESNDRDYGYNMTGGGEGLQNPTLEVRRKMSLAKQGIKQSEETIERRASALRGRKMSPETVEKRVQSRGHVPLTEEHKEQLRLSHLGKPAHENTKLALIRATEDRWSNPDNRRELSEKMTGENNPFFGQKHSPETRARWTGRGMVENPSPATLRQRKYRENARAKAATEAIAA